MAKASRLLPDDVAPGEEAALKYFLRDDPKIACAWWFFCIWFTDHKPAFARQLKHLAARMGRPVTHVDGIRVALRFWDLAMSSDPAFADQWRADREHAPRPKPNEWGEFGPLLNRLGEQEWQSRHQNLTPEDKERGKIWGEMFRRQTGKTLEEYFAAKGFTEDEAGAILARGSIEREAIDMACALVTWTASPQHNKIMALAERALSKSAAS